MYKSLLFLSLAAQCNADIDAIKWTGFELGYCSAITPNQPPPNPPGYWCSDYNRGYNEKACWTATQNCCYFNVNKTIPQYPGTGQCVHTDPCGPSGRKICGGQCYPLHNADGMMTCIRSSTESSSTPKYSTELCILKPTSTTQDVTNFMNWVCNPANSQVNCKMLNGGGANAYQTPGLTPNNSATDPGTYTQGSWALNQFYLLTGQCNSMGYLVPVPTEGPPVVKTPAPLEPPTPPPTPSPPVPPYHGKTMLFGTADCSVGQIGGVVDCAATVRDWVGGNSVTAVVAIGWDDPAKLPNVFENVLDPMWSARFVPVLDWLPYPYKTWTNPSPNVDIANGLYDDYIEAFYSQLEAYLKTGSKRVFIRFAPEANGDFFPWSPTCPSCTSTGQKISQSMGSYVAMWKYVRSKCPVTDPTAVQWIWSVNNVDAPDGSSTSEGVFPGVGSVDWATVDGFNWGDAISGNSWKTPDEVYSSALGTIRSLAVGKPIGITSLATVSSPNGVAAKASWYTSAFETLSTANISMLLLYNEDGSTDLAALGGKNGDYTATVNGHTLKGYHTIPHYLNDSAWLVKPQTSNTRIITDSQFQTGA
eukprot:TRINITY_DN3456_c1_g1_i2.p1 TRINITY_DN3456_c1_g1~~TRINITY_DN3456_c1_g1_i2.p1  ORF type:complete len:589 (+),score=87.91 TRINITY_DN3456_c1_g1_i2:81-1847(+)